MNRTVLFSDDGILQGSMQFDYMSCSYIARIDYVNPFRAITVKSFGNGVDAENYILNKLENPVFTILQGDI